MLALGYLLIRTSSEPATSHSVVRTQLQIINCIRIGHRLDNNGKLFPQLTCPILQARVKRFSPELHCLLQDQTSYVSPHGCGELDFKLTMPKIFTPGATNNNRKWPIMAENFESLPARRAEKNSFYRDPEFPNQDSLFQ